MNDLISRQAAIDAAVKMFEAWYGGSVMRNKEIRARFYALPSAERRGKWIAKRDGWNGGFVVCSVCFAENGMNSKFCPNCGAQMENE